MEPKGWEERTSGDQRRSWRRWRVGRLTGEGRGEKRGVRAFVQLGKMPCCGWGLGIRIPGFCWGKKQNEGGFIGRRTPGNSERMH